MIRRDGGDTLSLRFEFFEYYESIGPQPYPVPVIFYTTKGKGKTKQILILASYYYVGTYIQYPVCVSIYISV